MSWSKKRILLEAVAVFLLTGMFLAYSEVNNDITEEDILHIQILLKEQKVTPLFEKVSFAAEIGFIQAVQNAVLQIVAKGECIPKGRSREPKDVSLARCGESYDRSRLMEKIFRHAGFQTRHIMIFSFERTRSRLKELLFQSPSSHSSTEVLTQRGWLVVDPDEPWVSLNNRDEPLSLGKIQADVVKRLLSWNQDYAEKMPSVYKQPFTYVYGLYSRHGKFYPPHNFVPDINWREFAYNLTRHS